MLRGDLDGGLPGLLARLADGRAGGCPHLAAGGPGRVYLRDGKVYAATVPGTGAGPVVREPVRDVVAG